MKRYFSLIILLFACLIGKAQNRSVITGQLVGKQSLQPIEYASVALFSTSPYKVVGGTITDSTGVFILNNVPGGEYEIKVSYVGYKDYTSQKFELANGKKKLDLGKFYIDESSQSLNGIMVVGQKSTYQQTVDKKIFNVGSDISSGSGAVSDLLQHVPSIQVDMEGEVSLRGNDNVLILINGKPSILTKGANRGSVLQQIPASSIERIEVITNPSAQFKPDGTSGIINLILKKERAAGINGNIVANVGNNKRYNGGISLGWNTGNWGITGNYGYRKDRRDRTNINENSITDPTDGSQTFVKQYSNGIAPSTSHIGGLGVQWSPTKDDIFQINGNYTYLKFPRTEETNTLQWNPIQTEKEYSRLREAYERKQEGEGSFSYTHNFEKGNSISADYTYAVQGEIEDNEFTSTNTIPLNSTTFDNTNIKQNNYSNLARVIHTKEFDDNNVITSGIEFEFDKSNMNYHAWDIVDGNMELNTEKTNHFIFYQNIYTAYTTLEKSFNKVSLMPGVRFEYSNVRSKLITTGETVNNNLFMFFPTLHSSYKLNDCNELQLNYSLRVNRPEGDDMNPFPEYKDPYNLKTGNPNLKPEKIHSIEIGWQYKKDMTTLILTPYYRYTFNKLTSVVKVLPNRVMLTTKENMSSSSAVGAELVLNSGFGHWCSYNISSNVFYNTIDASDLGYSDKKGSVAWYISANSDFNVGKNIMVQLNARYNSSVITPQGKYGSTYIVNTGARYDIPLYNLAFTATVSDLFDSFKRVVIVDTPAIQQRLERRKAPRTIYFGVSYRFGSRQDSKKDKKLKYDESL